MHTEPIRPDQITGRPTSPFLRQGIGAVSLPLYGSPEADENVGAPVDTLHADPPLRSRHIVLVGFAETRHDAPYTDPNVEIWTMNQTSMLMPRWDRLVEPHDRACVARETAASLRIAHYENRLKAERERPIYMEHAHDDIPNSVRLPWERFRERFGEFVPKIYSQGGYITSALDWLMCLAIDKLITEPAPETARDDVALGTISIYGFDLTADDEYGKQRPGATFYCGYAAACGIRVNVPEACALLTADGLYGFAGGERMTMLDGVKAQHEARMTEIDREIAERRAIIEQNQVDVVRLSGMREQAAWSQGYVVSLIRGGSLKQ